MTKHASLLATIVSLSGLVGCQSRQSSTNAPDANALAHAAEDADNWLLPAKSYGSNRVTTLTDITPANVTHLSKAWVTSIADDGQQEAAPIVDRGVMYLSTPHNHILALDAATGALRWENPYTARYTILYFVNRGVAIADGKVFEATQDCRVIAVDAATGKTVWNVEHCPDTTNSLYSMAPRVYNGTVIVATGGGDNGTRGRVQAFREADGSLAWEWETIKRDTWPDSSWQHGGAAVWSGLSVDPAASMLYLPVGNAGPDLILAGRKGPDLYTNSLVALDITGGTPTVKWFYQLTQNDTHDADASMPPVLFTGTVAGAPRSLAAIGDKAGDLFFIDRSNGQMVYKAIVSNQDGLFTTTPTPEGTRACPNHGGGIEWNGGSYDAATNLFLIPSTQECGLWKTTVPLNGPVPYVPGHAYEGGALPTRTNGTGVLTAIDLGTGRVAWRDSLPYPAQGGVTLTTTGLAFTSDLSGRIYAMDTKTGAVLWHDDTGSPIIAPIAIYRANGHVYLAVVSGEPGSQRTPNLPPTKGSIVTAYTFDAPAPNVNSAAEQQRVETSATNASPAPTAATVGTAPYTQKQVAAGKTLYVAQCQSCHGAQLEGVSAPALTGPGIARAGLNVSTLHTIVAQQMPLTAPGSLSPSQYASIMAYLLAFDCIQPSNGGKVPFPTTDRPTFAQVPIGPQTCVVK